MNHNLFSYLLILMTLVLEIFYSSIFGNIWCNGAPVQYGKEPSNNWKYVLVNPTKIIQRMSENTLHSDVSNPLYPPEDTINTKNMEERMVRNIVV